MRSPSSIFNFNRSNPLAGIILFALCVVVIEATLAWLPQNSLIRSFRANHLPPSPPDWQIMGDSVAAGGIRSDLLSAQLAPKTNTFNMALSGSGPEFSYFILQREIAAGVAPKAIVYAPSPHTFASQRIALLVGAYATWPEIAEIIAARIEPFEVLYGIACKLSYSLRHREQLAEVIKGRRMPEGIEPAIPASNGQEANDEDRFPAKRVHPMYRKKFETTAFNLYFTEKFLRTAQTKEISLYWLIMPTLKVIQESRQPFHFQEDYQNFLEDKKKNYGVHLLTNPLPIMSAKYFADYTHLTPDGAVLFTDALGRQLIEEGAKK